jgi:thymidylate synthase
MFQFYVSNGKLSLQLYQRSGDAFLGIPFNIASYALLLHIFSKILSLQPVYFVHTIGDAHIYSTHMDVVKEQIQREPRPLPSLQMPEIDNLDVSTVKSLSVSDFVLVDYKPMPSLHAPMAV